LLKSFVSKQTRKNTYFSQLKLVSSLKVHLVIVFVTCLIGGCFCQLDNSSLFINKSVDTTQEKTFFIKVNNLNYMKNNEYAGLIADGFTLFGLQFNPQLGYQISKEVSVEGGIFLMKDFGNSQFATIAPTFVLRYKKGDFRMNFGNIDGSLNHRLIEPLYNFERVISNRLESGAQFLINKKHFDLDAWVDWRKATYPLSNNREIIWSGINLNLGKFKFKQYEFTIPLQGTIHHKGGQIDTSGEQMFLNYNYSAGLAVKYKFDSGKIQSIYADAQYVTSQRNLFDTVVFKNNGNGFFANLGVNAFQTQLVFTYWFGDSYRNDFGGLLYSSESSSVHHVGTFQRYRSLIIMRLSRTFVLAPKVLLTLRVEPYYDFIQSRFEYSYGFYINFDDKFTLKK
jgi:hypothetical protein